MEELTFLGTVHQFEAFQEEKGIALHENHHEQVKSAIQVFADKVEDEKAKDKKQKATFENNTSF